MSRRAIPLLLVLCCPCLASAQNEPATQEPTRPEPLTAGWQDGFFIQSRNEEYRLTIGMVAQGDGRFSIDDPPPIINTFLLRKLRPTFSGRMTRYFEFKVMPDFGNGTTVVQDAYFDVRLSPAFRIRTGKDKTPVGYELLQGDAFLWFPERSLASGLVPNRDSSVQVQGDLFRGRLSYTAGVYNGIPDGTSLTSEVDGNSGKDVAGRILLQPFRSSTPTLLSNFGVHIGGSRGNQAGALPSFRTSVGQTYFSYASSATASGMRHRVSPAVFYYFRRFGGFAEYMRSSQDVTAGTAVSRVTNRGWNLTGSMMLTGDNVSYGAIRPTTNFDPAAGHAGAVQLLARYARLTVDEIVVTRGLAAANASPGARSFTVAVNWFPNGFMKYYGTFERTVFDQSPTYSRPAEHVFLFRTQLGF